MKLILGYVMSATRTKAPPLPVAMVIPDCIDVKRQNETQRGLYVDKWCVPRSDKVARNSVTGIWNSIAASRHAFSSEAHVGSSRVRVNAHASRPEAGDVEIELTSQRAALDFAGAENAEAPAWIVNGSGLVMVAPDGFEPPTKGL
jgi:hypothetical protein